MQWQKREMSKKGTQPQTVRESLSKKDVTEGTEKLGSHRMLVLEGTLTIISSNFHVLPTSRADRPSP